MWIRDVDFPQSLIEAHRAGRLVVFVGAGASLDSPSNLPTFRTLTAEIAASALVNVDSGDLDRPDVVLGRLADQQVDVHRLIAIRIGEESSMPNRLHQAIVDLAVVGPAMRIVTTNYDRHLSTVLTARYAQLTEYLGPALPMGDDFTGLVYLHGSVSQEPKRLVVTDGDFGRAYLRDAWAARFLERMFATFTVLFVGYSHSDVVMRYLARGLGRDTPRYVLTPSPEGTDWPQLGLHPVGYQVSGGSHAALAAAIEGWASWASMGLLQHRQEAARLVALPPSQVPEQASYIEALVTDGERVGLFAEFARSEEWLMWAAAQPEFRRLFDPTAAPTNCTSTLAWWFAENFVMVEGLTAKALRVVRDLGGRLGRTVWSAIGQHLHLRGSPRPEWLRPWLVLLVQSAPDVVDEWLDYALVASRWPQDRHEALLLFDRLTEPQAVLRPTYGLGGETGFDVAIRGDDHWLREAWQSLFIPNLADSAPAVLAISDRHLRRAHQLLIVGNSAGMGWDPISFRRSAIEVHSQDQFGRAFDVVIDAARDCLQAVLDGGDDLGVGYLRMWAKSGVSILRRLVVHGWTYRSDVDATAKIAWLRGTGWLFDHQLRHEVFRLIETALSAADLDVADALVADLIAGPDDAGDDDHRAYERFNALAWVNRHAPDLQSAQEAFNRVKAENPEFLERPHPDLSSWIETGFVRPQPPMTSAELHDRITVDPPAAIAELRRYEDSTDHLGGPTWQDALAVLVDAVRDQPGDGFIVLDVIGGEHSDILRAVIGGWAAAANDAETAARILDRLAQVDLRTVAGEVARLLADGGQGGANTTEWYRFASARQLASTLWAAVQPGTTSDDLNGWLSRAINYPAGQLALFWMHAVADDWRDAGEGWSGLPAETCAQLDLLLAGDDDRTALAEVVLASQLHFLFGADRVWCERNVLPLLDWENRTRALRAWDGFLSWGRWNDQLLSAGLLKDYLDAARHIDDFDEERRRQLLLHLASMAVSSELDPLPWTREFAVASAVSEGDRSEWMGEVAWLLKKLPAEAVEHQWQRWIRTYWQDRLNSIPVQLTDKEASAMATWVVFLTDSIEEGVKLACAHTAGIGEHSNLLHDLDHERVDLAPVAFAKLITHLLRGTHPPFRGGHYLARIVSRLRTHPIVDVTAIIEEAMRLGCSNAPEW